MLPRSRKGVLGGREGMLAGPAAKMTIRARFVPVDDFRVNIWEFGE